MDRALLVVINIIIALYLLVITTVTAAGEMSFIAWVFASGITVILGVSLQVVCLFFYDFKVSVFGRDFLDLKPLIKNFIDTVMEMPDDDDTIWVCSECGKLEDEETSEEETN
jgi:hypothetical protein